MSSDEFRTELAALGLAIDGNHNELLRRVKHARMQGGGGAASGKRAATEREARASESEEAARPAAFAAEKGGRPSSFAAGKGGRPSSFEAEKGGRPANFAAEKGGVPMRKKQKLPADGLLDRAAGGGAGSEEEVGRQILSVCSLSLTNTPHTLSLSHTTFSPSLSDTCCLTHSRCSRARKLNF